MQSKPTLKLTFIPDEKYYVIGDSVDIQCEILNPNENMESPQLWYIDFKTADSARYECDCPDCEERLDEQTKDLQVMKLAEPKWHITPSWPLQEHAKTTIKCTVHDFYPFVSYKIIHHHHDISNEGKSVVPTNHTYPQKFSWEATVTPTADWHNTILRCIVTEGSSVQHVTKNLEVLFSPRFLKCDERQHVNSTKEKATIECSYAGNPPPKLIWLRQTDKMPIISDVGVIIETKDEHHGRHKSIVTFDREKLITIPLTTTIKSRNRQLNITGDNYYQQLLNGGFIVKLMLNNEEKLSRKINIVSIGHINQARPHPIDSSTTKTAQNLSTYILLFSFLIMLYLHA